MTQAQRRRLWDDMLAAEMRSAYYGDMAGTYGARQRWLQWSTLFCASGAAATVLASLPREVAIALSLVTAGISLYSALAGLHRLAVESADLHYRWNTVTRGYQQLWDEQDHELFVADFDARAEALRTRAGEISKSACSAPLDEARWSRWQDSVIQQHIQQQTVAA